MGRCLATGFLFLLGAVFTGFSLRCRAVLGLGARFNCVWFGWSCCVFESPVGADVVYHSGVAYLKLRGDSVWPFGVEECDI